MHAGVADQDVVQGVVKDMPHMKDTGHIGGRYDYGIWFPPVGFGMKEIILQPIGVPFVLYF